MPPRSVLALVLALVLLPLPALAAPADGRLAAALSEVSAPAEDAPTEDVPTEDTPAEDAPQPVADFRLGPPPLEELVPDPVLTLLVTWDDAPLEVRGVLLGDTAWLPAAQLASAVLPDVRADETDGRVTAEGECFTLTADGKLEYLEVNGRCLYIPGGPVSHPDTGALLVPAHTLAMALGLTAERTGETLALTGPAAPLTPGDAFYDADDLDLIARVVYHESGNQPIAGQIAVANVILNRVAAGSAKGFRDTVRDVIFQKNQFPNATTLTPDAEAIACAKMALEGAMTVPGACWFNRTGLTGTWAARNKTLLYTIGAHDFYG